MRIFLDANILFSAAKSDGAMRRLLHWLVEAGHECWGDTYVETEARRNLQTKEPHALPVLDALLGYVKLGPAPAFGAYPEETAWLPEKDRPVLIAAIRLKCDVLLTGDRTHFGAGYSKTFGGVVIHSPRSLAESLFG